MKTKLLILTCLTCLIQAETNQSAVNSPLQDSYTSTNTPSLINANANTVWVDQKVDEIKPQRNGLNIASLARLKSPFIVIKEEVKEKTSTSTTPGKDKSATDGNELVPTKKDMSKEPLTLQVVLNSSALINGKWLKTNDLFRGYKLTKIQHNHVILERKKKKIKLFIAQKSDNINISIK